MSERAIPEHRGSPADTNDILHDKSYNKACHTAPSSNFPRILVWSAGDESGIGRLMDCWQEYFLTRAAANASEEKSFMDKVAYTPDRCRSSLPWKTFVTIDSTSKLSRIEDFISHPVRSGGGQTLPFAFTGQGAVYNGIGIVLLAYPMFKEILETFDRELMGMDASGQCLVKGHGRRPLSVKSSSEKIDQ